MRKRAERIEMKRSKTVDGYLYDTGILSSLLIGESPHRNLSTAKGAHTGGTQRHRSGIGAKLKCFSGRDSSYR